MYDLGMAKRSGIYTITHVASGKQYVGQSASIRDRWLWHKSSLRRGKSANRILQNAWTKYGEAAFLFEVMEECDPTDEALCAREQFWIDTLKPAFNIAPVGGTTRGLKHPPRSEEFKRRQSEARKGYKPSEKTIALLRQRAAEIQYRHPPEVRARISSALTGLKRSPEHIEKTRAANIGRKHSAEHIAKRVAKLKGHVCSDYTKARTAQANRERLTGTKQSAELIEKRIAPLRGRKRDPALVEVMLAGLRKSREDKAAPIKALIAANPHLNITELTKLTGVSFKTTSRYRKELLCQTPPPSGSAGAAQSSPQIAEPSSASPSAKPPRQSSLFG